jgi:Phosphate-selective porin O and P
MKHHNTNISITITFILFLGFIFNNLDAQEKSNFSPKYFGYVRAWHQTDISKNETKFSIKMARFGVKGKVNEYAGYRVFVDFARLGNLKTTSEIINGTEVLTSASAKFSDVLLDAEVILSPLKNISFSAGQFKVPFGTDNLRSGSSIDFINRPLLTKVAPGLRDIGLMCTYKNKTIFPLELKAGLFNGSGQNKTENDNTTNYSLRVVTKLIDDLSLSANYYGGKSSGADLSIFDFGADYKIGKIFLSGEFGQRRTTLLDKETIANSYFVYAMYDLVFDNSIITHCMPTIRYESYDPNSSLSENEIGRVTMGIALQFAKTRYAQFRVNYELYDYKNGSTNPNKLIVELQTKF